MSIKVSFKNSRMYIRLAVLIALLLALGIVAYMQVKADQEIQPTQTSTSDVFPPDETDSVFDYTPAPTKVISRIIDLAQGLPDYEKYVYIIQRVDGSYEKYIVNRWHSEDLQELLQMGPNDKLINEWPFAPILHGHFQVPPDFFETPEPSDYPTLMSTPDVSSTVITPDTYP